MKKIPKDLLKKGLTVPEVVKIFQVSRYKALKLLEEAGAVQSKEKRVMESGREAYIWR